MSNSLVLVVGLGANLGPRRDTLRAAVHELKALASREKPFRVSSLYESEPIGPPQPKFLNAAVLLATRLDPIRFLNELQSLERQHGRVRAERWGPRTLDLDLLWIDGVAVDHACLTVPHPELGNRPFALLPLLEVAPWARRSDGGAWSVLAAGFPTGGGLVPIEGPEWAGPLPDALVT